ncbi:MAG: SGNH/GDSL hydrolase family protein [Candidatus Nanopelagicales bacterium]
MAQWHRYVAIGDSFTEGLEDPGPDGRHRGWADRVAEALAAPDFAYANLAIRGRLLAPILNEQLPAALDLDPDLITIAGGVNDALRPGWDLAQMAADWDRALARTAAAGADTYVVTFGQPSRRSRAMGRIEGRLGDYREVLLDTAARHDAHVVDFWYAAVFDDPRFWAEDRLHLSPLGHERVAWAVLDALGRPTPDWLAPLPPADPVSPLARVAADASWVAGHLGPWLGRRLTGRSSGDGLAPKRPRLAPVDSSALPAE